MHWKIPALFLKLKVIQPYCGNTESSCPNFPKHNLLRGKQTKPNHVGISQVSH